MDHALVVLKGEGLVTLDAAVVLLLRLASQHQVVSALSKDQRIIRLTARALTGRSVLLTELHPRETSSIGEDVTIGAVGAGSWG
jgi:ABC-type tungstate transport system permease subunit